MVRAAATTHLWLDGQPIDWALIRERFDAVCADRSPYAVQTLAFCRQWLSGAATFVLHTSGSTGTPKPITLTRAQMIASARATGAALGLHAGMRALVCLNTAYIAGVMMLVRGFALGLELVIVPPDAHPLRDWPLAAPCDFTALVPLQLRATLDAPVERQRLAAMHAVLVGGAPVTSDLVAALADVPAPVYHTYGMTETVTHIALRRLNPPGAPPDELFVPLPGVTLATDARDCLTVRGPMTAEATVVTNDRVALRADGSFRWLGRVDNVINSGGVKVQAEKVEAALQALLPQRRLFVAGLPDGVLGEAVTAVIEGPPLPADLAAALAADLTLTRYERPRQIVCLPHFDETPTGKIDRAATLARLRSAQEQPTR